MVREAAQIADQSLELWLREKGVPGGGPNG
jgi:hypothetical protein